MNCLTAKENRKLVTMAKIEIQLPSMGEGITDATITKWLVKPGDEVEEDQSIVEIATDKVDSEIPSPETGTISELRFEEGEAPQVGDVLAVLNTGGADEPVDKKEVKEDKKEDEKELPRSETTKQTVSQPVQSGEVQNRTETGKFLSPLVRSIAKKENISTEELESIRGTSNTGRITKKDILDYIEQKSDQLHQPSVTEKSPTPEPTQSTSEISSSDDVEIIKMDRMRKLIADHMVESVHTSPHVTSFVEADVTNMVKWRNKNKEKFLTDSNTKITFTPLFIEAAVKAIKDFPLVNSSLNGENILVKKRINIGIATALPSGNLIVPVIKDADSMNIIGLSKNVNDLASRARSNHLKPEEIQGGTFTITNFGTFGNISGTPIINQPQVAILGVGSITKQPAVIETKDGDMIAIRHRIILSLSYDHRIVDGALGGMFLKKVADYLEDFDVNRTF